MIDETKSRQNRPDRGFSMIEVIMALLVIFVLAAMATPQVRSMVYNYRLQGAVASCTWSIQSARYEALQQGYPFQVVFSSSAGTYQIQNLPPTCAGVTPCATYQNVGSAVPISGVTVTMNQDTTLQFKPNGAVTATTGGLAFTLTYQSKTNTITVSTYGNVKVS
ncbi:MAG TPA: GspH/FimT family pseudopilin [Verrucomicrobiae bacterium]|nr:GspH/FimT family pseudopilin [Verrucomicrobiae bacterium]